MKLMEQAGSHWEILSRGQVVVSNTPEQLWENAVSYFKWCEENPIKNKKSIASGAKAGTTMTETMTRPFTVKALCLHCGILEDYIRTIRQTKDKTSLYYNVMTKILYIIYIQNQELATVGVFNPIFTAKILNIDTEERSTTPIKIEIVQGLPVLSESENEVLSNIENENRVFENGDV